MTDFQLIRDAVCWMLALAATWALVLVGAAMMGPL